MPQPASATCHIRMRLDHAPSGASDGLTAEHPRESITSATPMPPPSKSGGAGVRVVASTTHRWGAAGTAATYPRGPASRIAATGPRFCPSATRSECGRSKSVSGVQKAAIPHQDAQKRMCSLRLDEAVAVPREGRSVPHPFVRPAYPSNSAGLSQLDQPFICLSGVLQQPLKKVAVIVRL